MWSTRAAVAAIASVVVLFTSLLAAPAALATPGEATNLAWCTGTKNCLQWSAVGGATSYRVYRGETASLPCDVNPHLDSCRDSIVVTTSTGNIITEVPASGRFYWYLVTAVDGTGEGPWGNATVGPRQVNDTGTCGASCLPAGAVCAAGGDCCSTACLGSHCQNACCVPTSGFCNQNGDCCSNVCMGSQCQPPCVPGGGFCVNNSQCCSGVCSANACTAACSGGADCPGTDTACRTRTCSAGVCGFSYAPNGTVVPSAPGDCHANVCDGAGNIVSVVDDNDLPADDGNQCTSETCSAGTPQHPVRPLNFPCSQNGGQVCGSSGQCVQCNSASQCPGTDNQCQQRICQSSTCGINYASPGTTCNEGGGTVCSGSGLCVQCNANADCAGLATPCRTATCQVATHTCLTNNLSNGTVVPSPPGDCHANVCDGSGNPVNTVDDSDVPADDGNQCTSETCVNGSPQHPIRPLDFPCSQNGGQVCSSFGTCVQCNAASQCPGADTSCHMRTCQASTCGFNNPANGTVVPSPVGDCHVSVCDGSGNTNSVVDDTDVPADDGNQCTGEACASGTPIHPNAPGGTACSQGGGTVCDGSGSCVVPPAVQATTPADGTGALASTPISIVFSQAMNPATLSEQTASGACSGSIQVSLDNFTSCIAFSTGSPAMLGGNTTAVLNPQPGLLVNRTYKIRVTTAATAASGVPLSATYNQSPGFTTNSPNLCDGSLVITQVYGGGGMPSASFRNDFVEIRNRGNTNVNLAGYSIQYASAAGSTWLVTNLSGNLLAGKYYLVQLFSSGAIGAVLPTPDATGTTDISAVNGKVALVASTTALTGVCPTGPLDFVGYGTANCNEGGANAPGGSNTTSVTRNQLGCGDINQNNTDFTALPPNPRNTAVSTASCVCTARNESSFASEADYCAIQFPSFMNVQAATTTPQVFGQVFEAGVTEAAGSNGLVRAQLGYGPPTANPEYQAGWSWFNAGYNLQVGNNDEYQASFTAPGAGSYRYAYRFSIDQGVSWTYCDTTAGDGGSGSNAGLTFDIDVLGVLTSTP